MKKRDAAKKAAKRAPERWATCKHLRNKMQVTHKIRDEMQSIYLVFIEENKGDPKRM